MKRALIFDLDGTLWDSSKEVADSWNVILSDYENGKYMITLEDMQNAMGLTMLDLGKKLWQNLSKDKMIALLSRCMSYENEYLSSHPGKLYPKEEKTLKTLQKEYSIFIVSNAQKGYIEAFLEGTNLSSYFEGHLSWGDTKTSKDLTILKIIKDYSIDEAIYIGDTEMDEESTRKAGLPFIHAKYGFGKAKKPDGVIENFSQLPAVADSLFSFKG